MKRKMREPRVEGVEKMYLIYSSDKENEGEKKTQETDGESFSRFLLQD
jgi:hypothetical protein